jgi:hypothetical protein
MKYYFTICLCVFSFLHSYSQENNNYFVTASSGLLVRAQPHAKASKIGKLPYGSTIAVIEKTDKELQLKDQGTVIR